MAKKSKEKKGSATKQARAEEAAQFGKIISVMMLIPALGFGGVAVKWSYEAVNPPTPPPPPPTEPTPPPPPPWGQDEAPNVAMLDGESFPAAIADQDTLVMFYAPWCGHCKAAKPELQAASDELVEAEGKPVKLAAVDCTADESLALCMQYNVKGYPTINFFAEGKLAYTYSGGRKQADFIEFAKDPQEPPPPPPPPKPWDEESGPNVVHFNDAKGFNRHIGKTKSTLVMFYAPWCGHCKAAKPEFVEAGAELADDADLSLAGVDCTQPSAKKLCEKYDVKGYPTLKLFESGYSKKNKAKADYDSPGRKAADFVEYMRAL